MTEEEKVETASGERASSSRTVAFKALVTSGSVASAAGLRFLLEGTLEENVPYLISLVAVALTTYLCGWRFGVLATLLSILLGNYLFARPSGAVHFNGLADLLSALIFVLAAAVIIVALAFEAAARRKVQQADAQLLADLAARSRLELELAEARRLESLGRLAGGVAHDFNNLLTVVLGSSEELRRDSSSAAPVDRIEIVAKRGADLTKQLLGLARRQMMAVRPLSLNDSVREAEQLAERLIPEDIRLEVSLESEPWLVEGDPTQIQQVLINLITNARDALPQGGTLSIRTRNATLSEQFSKRHPEVSPGEYVELSVTDNGAGMSDELQSRIFDPFFTTKPGERGTGLGLAVVHGIVKQLNGHVSVFSRPGHGTRFDLYFPRAARRTAGDPSKPASSLESAPLTVLLVEDDELVRGVTHRMLERLGHRVLSAENGAVALNLARSYRERIDLLVTDVVMPWTNGRELAVRLRETRPELRVVFISGYTENVVLQRGILKPGVHLLKKPFSQEELAAALQHAAGSERVSA